MASPLVSIAMPVYNAEKTLAAAVRSILYQTYTNFELIVIDDGSTDNTLSIARSFKDPRIKIISDGNNSGLSTRLNQALDICGGEYFARMDSDDVSFPERIEKQVHFLNEHEEVDLMGAGILIYQENGNLKGVVPILETHEEICRSPWGGFYMAHPTWMGRTGWFLKYRYRSLSKKASSDKAQDQFLLFRTHRTSRFACINEVLLGYREDGRSLKKSLKARYLLCRGVAFESIRRGWFYTALMSVINQSLKMLGDILSIKFGIMGLRNSLLTADSLLAKRWDDIWGMVNSPEGSMKNSSQNVRGN